MFQHSTLFVLHVLQTNVLFIPFVTVLLHCMLLVTVPIYRVHTRPNGMNATHGIRDMAASDTLQTVMSDKTYLFNVYENL